jgi:hypothetical protein
VSERRLRVGLVTEPKGIDDPDGLPVPRGHVRRRVADLNDTDHATVLGIDLRDGAVGVVGRRTSLSLSLTRRSHS